MKIYYISGLGANETVFQKMDFAKKSNAYYLPWLIPEENESIASYASRMLENVEEDSILVGLSFGGMMAIEMAKLKKMKKLILISSAKSKNEIPTHFKWAGAIGITQLLPLEKMMHMNAPIHYYLGSHSEEEKQIVNAFIKEVHPYYLTWSVRQICNWKNTVAPCPIIHIHGTDDKILDYHNIHANYTIKDGNHFMVMNKAEEINTIINQALSPN